ncbi:MAG: sensor histidine kinase [Sphaerochaeta sp.]|jgi:signal transduction histidine kinase|nr:sensor histidine kinase [Sphaerochaeta sp.]
MKEPGFSERKIHYETLVSAYVVVLLSLALLLFIVGYGYRPTDQYPYEFFRTFFIFFALYALMMLLLLRAEQLLGILLLCFLGLTVLLVLGYSLNDYLTIRLMLYLAFQAALLSRLPWPWSLPVPPLLSLSAALVQHLPSFLGENTLTPLLIPPTAGELLVFFAVLCTAGFLQIASARYHELHDKATRQVALLDATITKLTVFNQSLQSYARRVDHEATKKERYRISREIHDISGYMFTNIIAMMDALIASGCTSSERTSELCTMVRSQAQEGLTETRKALHLLRTSEVDDDRGLRAIFKIKKIFESTTGVTVDIESGNLPPCFDGEVDFILYRIVQEGLTNALRHGHATHVRILFWIIGDVVQVIVLDNGTGSKKITKGIGLAGMEERISRLGGTVRAENAPEGGFQLTVTIPLHPQEEIDDPDFIG